MDHVNARPIATRRSDRFRVWHLSLLVLFVAIAIVQIQDQRIVEPVLVGTASAGFFAYAVVGWLAARRLLSWSGSILGLVLYLGAMSAVFLIATLAYVTIENYYRMGHF
jgi:hypothetical protein